MHQLLGAHRAPGELLARGLSRELDFPFRRERQVFAALPERVHLFARPRDDMRDLRHPVEIRFGPDLELGTNRKIRQRLCVRFRALFKIKIEVMMIAPNLLFKK